MSILVRDKILSKVKSGNLVFDPSLDSLQIQTHSVDLRLGYTFLVPRSWKLTNLGRESVQVDNEKNRDLFEVIELEEGQFFEILPHEYVIVATLEKIKLPQDLMAVLYPRSSVSRRGLSVDSSGIVDAGYEGNLIIPLRNNTASQVIRLFPGERFCQLVFHDLGIKVVPQKSRYAKKDIVVGVLPERNREEAKLVQKGKIKELKKKFGLKS